MEVFNNGGTPSDSIEKMLLWLALCFASAVIAQDTNQPSIAEEISEEKQHSSCGYEEVLFKIWAILSNILDTGGAIKVPNRHEIDYALTLIKKSVLEYTDNQNVDALQKLFQREAALAKYKGIYLNDKRSLKSLLELELYPNDQNSKITFKYELRSNDIPACREAFEKLIQTSHQEFGNLAESPACNDNNDWLSAPNPNNSRIGAESLLYNNIYNNGVQLTSKNKYETYLPALYSNANPKGVLRDINPLVTEVNSAIKQNSAELNSLTKLLPLQVVELTKNPGYLLENNFTADLEHAQRVSDEINKLYQTNKVEDSQPLKVDLTPEQQPNNNIGRINNQPFMTSRITKQVMHPSYADQKTNFNFYNPNNKLNPVSGSYTASNSLLINSKYYSNPYQNYAQNQGIPQNNVPGRNYENFLYLRNNEPKTINLAYKYYSNPHQNNSNLNNAESPNSQNNYPYQPKVANNPLKVTNNLLKVANNPPNVNFNYYPVNKPIQETFKPQPRYTTGSNLYGLRQLQHNQYNDNLNAMHKFGYQNNLATVDNRVIQNVPQPLFYKGNKGNPYNINVNTNIQYSTLSRVQNPYAPQHVIHLAANYNNGEPVIDTLANWISGTNSERLNLNIENDKTEIELTYLVKKPPPVVYKPTTYFITFRVPYKAFVKHFTEFLSQPNLRSSDKDLYNDLVSRYNGTVINADVPPTPTPEDLEENRLIKARLIADSFKSVDIVNTEVRTGLNNVDEENPASSNDVANSEIPLQADQ